jgi:nicotinate-nucleotide pyrophosphorylase (carboxylating)
VAARVFGRIDPNLVFQALKEDGQEVANGDFLAEIQGNSVSLLKGERTALNFLQRLSGIATTTFEFVKVMGQSGTEILDTRKTTPGLRILEKYAVKMGGGRNHRQSLSDMVLIKDNHLRIVGSISEAVKRARERIKPEVKIEVETANFQEMKEAFQSGADMILLDNMDKEEIKKCVVWVNNRVPLEVSGNVSLRSVKTYAGLGVDYISVGSLTHSFRSLDISMEIVE